MNIDDIGREIEGYLNANNKNVTYSFLSAGDKDETTGINVLRFSVHFVNTYETFLIDYSLPQEGIPLDTKKGVRFPSKASVIAGNDETKFELKKLDKYRYYESRRVA